MKHAVFPLLVLIAACSRSAPGARRPSQPSAVQTVDSVTPNSAVIQPPPTLTDLGPAPRSGGDVVQQTATAPPPTPQDEALRASLPFSPAVAMDPVDGSKISIRASTPTAEYKGHIFYFSSEANKRAFTAAPDQYLKGAFARL